MNILVTLDRNYLPPLRVMLGSLLRNDPGETFEIYAIGDGLMPEDWAALEELCAGRGRIHPLEVPADLFADAPVARYWTRAMYYRLLAAELLPRSLDRVLYLDPDILVINPVRALYDTDLEGDLMAAATHTGLRGPAQRNLIGKVNLATQIILNLGLCYGTLYLGPMWGNFLYFALEVLVFSVEAFVYNRYLLWPEGKKPHPILYALTANLLSFGIGLELNTHCTNTQIRLIGLVCLVLWYAGPWLCRKLRKVQNAQ